MVQTPVQHYGILSELRCCCCCMYLISLILILFFCDLDGSRTHTPLRALAPQASVSTIPPRGRVVPSVGVEPTQDFRLTSSEPVVSQPVAPRRYLYPQ